MNKYYFTVLFVFLLCILFQNIQSACPRRKKSHKANGQSDTFESSLAKIIKRIPECTHNVTAENVIYCIEKVLEYQKQNRIYSPSGIEETTRKIKVRTNQSNNFESNNESVNAESRNTNFEFTTNESANIDSNQDYSSFESNAKLSSDAESNTSTNSQNYSFKDYFPLIDPSYLDGFAQGTYMRTVFSFFTYNFSTIELRTCFSRTNKQQTQRRGKKNSFGFLFESTTKLDNWIQHGQCRLGNTTKISKCSGSSIQQIFSRIFDKNYQNLHN